MIGESLSSHSIPRRPVRKGTRKGHEGVEPALGQRYLHQHSPNPNPNPNPKRVRVRVRVRVLVRVRGEVLG